MAENFSLRKIFRVCKFFVLVLRKIYVLTQPIIWEHKLDLGYMIGWGFQVGLFNPGVHNFRHTVSYPEGDYS